MTDFIRQQRRRRLWQWMQIAAIVLFVFVFGAAALLAFLRGQAATALDAKLASIRTSGLPITPAELNAYAALKPGETDIAPRLDAILATLPGYDYKHPEPMEYPSKVLDACFNHVRKPIPEATLAKVRVFLARYPNALANLRSLADVAEPRYILDYTKMRDLKIPPPRQLLTASLLLQWDAVLHAETDAVTTLADIRALMTIAMAFRAEPCDALQFWSGTPLSAACDAMRVYLCQAKLTIADLDTLIPILESAAKQNTLESTLIGERVRVSWMYDQLQRSTDPGEYVGRVGSRFPTSGHMTFWKAAAAVLGEYYTPFYVRSSRCVQDYCDYLGYLDGGGALSRGTSVWLRGIASHDEWFRLTHDELNSTHPFFRLTRLIEPLALHRASNTAPIRLMYAATIIEKFRIEHQCPPKTIAVASQGAMGEEMMDPLAEFSELQYVAIANSYAIYSVGMDGVDDGGMIAGSALPLATRPTAVPCRSGAFGVKRYRESLPLGDIVFWVAH